MLPGALFDVDRVQDLVACRAGGQTDVETSRFNASVLDCVLSDSDPIKQMTIWFPRLHGLNVAVTKLTWNRSSSVRLGR